MEASSRRTSFVATALLSVAAFAVSPILVGDEDWVRHTMSEAGSQGVDGAWLGNLAFLLFGLCSWVATRAQPRWVQRGGGAFATCMIGVAAFSTRAGATGFDAMEDHLHSIFATAMGFAFAGTVVARAWIDRGNWAIHGVALAASVVLPAMMTIQPDLAGIHQRLMFLVAMGWFGWLAWHPSSITPRSRPEV